MASFPNLAACFLGCAFLFCMPARGLVQLQQFPNANESPTRAGDSSYTATALCVGNLLTFINDLLNTKLYALQMIDSLGKFPSGLLKGNIQWLGNYDECSDVLDIESPITGGTFNGRYCILSLGLPLDLGNSSISIEEIDLSLKLGFCVPDSCLDNHIKSFLNKDICNDTCSTASDGVCSDGGYNSEECSGPTCKFCVYGTDCTDCGPRTFLLSSFIPLPSFLPIGSNNYTVDQAKITALLDNATTLDVHCTSELEISELTGALVVIGIFGLLVFLVVMGTIYDIIKAYQEPSVPRGMMTTISQPYSPLVNNNGIDEPAEKNHIPTILAGHSHNETDGSPPGTGGTEPADANAAREAAGQGDSFYNPFGIFSLRRNTKYLLEEWDKKPPVSYLKGIYVLSIWWLMLGNNVITSGLHAENILDLLSLMEKFIAQAILSYHFAWDSLFLISAFLVTYVTLEEMDDRSFSWIRYYLRRILRLTVTYMTVMCLWMFCGLLFVGPPSRYKAVESAQPCFDHWWTYLLYISNLYPFPGNINKECLTGSWFFSTLMQFYVLSPFIIFLLHRRWKLSLGVIGLLIACSLTAVAYLSWYYGLTASLIQSQFNDRGISGGDYTETKPYTRCTSFLTGMVLAFIIQRHGKKIKLGRVWYTIGWMTAIAMGLSIVYGQYGTWHDSEWSQAVTVFYLAASQLGWSLAVGWMVFACATGYGGPINTFLSWSAWTPLANISLTAYLFYPIAIEVYWTWRQNLFYLSIYDLFYLYVGHVGFTYAYALILGLLVDIPLQQLIKKALQKKHIDVI